MQTKVTDFFNIIEDTTSSIEKKVTKKIEESHNLNDLIKTLEEMHTYMTESSLQEKYN